jgi:hypothetical protein
MSCSRDSIQEHGGRVFKMVGDAFFAAFSHPPAPLAAVNVRRALRAEQTSVPGGLRVRAALPSGVVEDRDGDYFGARATGSGICWLRRAAANPSARDVRCRSSDPDDQGDPGTGRQDGPEPGHLPLRLLATAEQTLVGEPAPVRQLVPHAVADVSRVHRHLETGNRSRPHAPEPGRRSAASACLVEPAFARLDAYNLTCSRRRSQ